MALLSIYDTFTWAPNTNYNLYDIYKYNNLWYYANQKHNSGISFNSIYSDGITTYNNLTLPYFFWKPSYDSDENIKPSIKKAQFGEGYAQSTPDGINNILLPFNLLFDKRTDAETRAIIHFLNDKKGTTTFAMIPPFPFNVLKLFKCEQWSHRQIFANHHTISAIFTETPI